MCTTYFLRVLGILVAINWLGGTDTQLLLVVDRLVFSVGTIILVKVFALPLSHYSQNLESQSNVVYSLASLPLELIQSLSTIVLNSRDR